MGAFGVVVGHQHHPTRAHVARARLHMEKTAHTLEEAIEHINAGVLFLDLLQDSTKPDQDTKIHDEGVALLCEHIKPDTKLKSLNLYNQGLTPKGVEALANILAHSHLVKLRLGENQIGDEGCRVLSRALNTSKLTNLDLYENGITDEGLKLLLFHSPPSLNGLTLEHNNLSGDGLNLLKDWNFNPRAWRLRHKDELVLPPPAVADQ
jgi:hypothetical protein